MPAATATMRLLIPSRRSSLSIASILGRLDVAGVGFGATTHLAWEVIEYAVMKLGSSGLDLTY